MAVTIPYLHFLLSYKPHAPPQLTVASPPFTVASPQLTVAPLLNCRSKLPVLELGLRRRWRSRGISVVTRAGPSSGSYIFALVLPIVLLAITIITSIRVADRLDEKFLEELALEESLESEGDDDEINTSPKEAIETPRRRSRPKREVENSSP